MVIQFTHQVVYVFCCSTTQQQLVKKYSAQRFGFFNCICLHLCMLKVDAKLFYLLKLLHNK